MSKVGWRQRFRDLLPDLKDLGGMKGVSLKAGLGETALRDVLERGRDPSVDNFLALCLAAHVDPSKILFDDAKVVGVRTNA